MTEQVEGHHVQALLGERPGEGLLHPARHQLAVHQHDPLVAAAVLGVLQAVASGLGLDEELSDPFGHQRGRGHALNLLASSLPRWHPGPVTPPSDVLLTLERYYDTVPRSLSTTEECGPFTIFVPTEVTKWTFYARPRLGLTEEVTADDVRRVLDRRAELGLPRNIEWVDEVTPSLRPAVAAAVGEHTQRYPLLVRRADPVPAEQPGVVVLTPDHPDLAAAIGAVGASFGSTDTFEPATLTAQPRLIEEGELIVVAAYDADGAVVGGGSTSPRGDGHRADGHRGHPAGPQHGAGLGRRPRHSSGPRCRPASRRCSCPPAPTAPPRSTDASVSRTSAPPASSSSTMREVRRVGPDDWEAWRDIRLRSLRDSPDAFGSTYEREAPFTEALWRERLTQGPRVLVLEDGEPVALGGGFPVDAGLMVFGMWTDPAHRGRGHARAILDVVTGVGRRAAAARRAARGPGQPGGAGGVRGATASSPPASSSPCARGRTSRSS